jgi:integrase
MSRPRNSIPPYEFHKSTNRAYVRLRLPDGGRRIVYLGKFNSPESRAEYGRIVAELTTAKISERAGPGLGSDISVNEILLAFLRHADQHYRRTDGTLTNEMNEYRQTLRPLKELYGHTLAVDFGPLALKAVRQKMIATGLCRTLVNRRIGRVKRVFKWAASEQLVPASILVSLQTVNGLQKGRSEAPEREPIRPVAAVHVDATIPFLTPTVAAMVRLHQAAGMRPQDVCGIRPADIDSSGPVWKFCPPQHKSAWRDTRRTVLIGPRGQEVLKEFWPTDPADYFFSPRRSVDAFHAARSAARKTPKFASHLTRNIAKRTPRKNREPGKKYTNQGYGKAIEKAVLRQNRDAARHDVPDGHHGPNMPRVPHWSPNQLRHAYATEVRKKYGLEAAQVLLGHARADVTQVYAERDLALGERVAAEVG